MAAKTAKSSEGTTERVELARLRLYQRNPRKGNVGAIAASLKANEQYKPITVNIGTHTGRPNEVLAGNHTLKAFRLLAQKNPDAEQWKQILVHWVDYDAEQAAAVVLVDNKTSASGTYDNDVLGGLLADVSHDFEGTGFTQVDLDGLTALNPNIDPDLDPEDPDEQSGRGSMVISYSIVFDTPEQRKKWVEFLNGLKMKNPDNTVGERISAYVADLAEDSE